MRGKFSLQTNIIAADGDDDGVSIPLSTRLSFDAGVNTFLLNPLGAIRLIRFKQLIFGRHALVRNTYVTIRRISSEHARATWEEEVCTRAFMLCF